MNLKILVTLFLIIILANGCSKSDSSQITASAIVGKPKVDSSLVEVTYLNVSPIGCLDTTFTINGHIIIKTEQMRNEVTFQVLDENNNILKESKQDFLSGDNDFKIIFTPEKLGINNIKLFISFRDKKVYQNIFKIDIKKAEFYFELTNEEIFVEAERDRMIPGVEGYIYESYIELNNTGVCPANNIKYELVVIGLENNEIISNSTQWIKLLEAGKNKKHNLVLFKPKDKIDFSIKRIALPIGYELDWDSLIYTEKPSEYKIIVRLFTDDAGTIPKENIVKVEKLFGK